MRTQLLVIATLSIGGLSAAVAAPDPRPFAAYLYPPDFCDMRPAPASCLASEASGWRAFLRGRAKEPFQHIQKVRLVDVDKRGGWAFYVVVPDASTVPHDLTLTLGGVPIDQASRPHVHRGSLILEVSAGRAASGLSPGNRTLVATRGTRTVFTLDLELEDGPPDEPDPDKIWADIAAATKQPPFLVAGQAWQFATVHLHASAGCTLSPPQAGCAHDTLAMWRDLVLGKLPGHPHTTRFTAETVPASFGPGTTTFWWFTLIFPDAPNDHANLRVLVDGVPTGVLGGKVLAMVEYLTKAVYVDLHFHASEVSVGRHEIAVVNGKGNVLFSTKIELVR